jgi:hypothetical protein
VLPVQSPMQDSSIVKSKHFLLGNRYAGPECSLMLETSSAVVDFLRKVSQE